MPNAFVSKSGYSIIPFDKVIAILPGDNDYKLLIYVSDTVKVKLVFKSPSDLETQRVAFLAYLTPTKPLI